MPGRQGLKPINPWALAVMPVSINATARPVVAGRNDRVIVLLLLGGFFRLALVQIGCQRDGQDTKTKEVTEFSRDSCTTRGVKKTPPCLPLSQNATPSMTGGQNPGENPRAECGSVAACDTERAPRKSPHPGVPGATGRKCT